MQIPSEFKDPKFYVDSYYRPCLITFVVFMYSFWVLELIPFDRFFPVLIASLLIASLLGLFAMKSKTTRYTYYPLAFLLATFAMYEVMYSSLTSFFVNVMLTVLATTLVVKNWDADFLPKFGHEMRYTTLTFALAAIPHLYMAFS